MIAGRTYSESVRPSRLTARVRCLEGGPLTSLHEVVAPAVARLPQDVRRAVVREFYQRHDAAPDWGAKYQAQAWIEGEVRALRRARVDVAFDEAAIDEAARRGAALCSKFLTFDLAASYAREMGVEPPAPGQPARVTRAGALKRLQCFRWWRRALRRQWTRQAEAHMRGLGFVQRRRQLYATDRAVGWRRQRKLRDRALLKELQAVSSEGDQLELWGVVEKSNANPAIRRAELMVRLKGFEEVAAEAGHVADFYTLTAPSAFHAVNSDGRPNPHFAGRGPRDAQAWLCRMWARARAKLKRLSLLVYGFRIAEPHHDGTPHWHMILFSPAEAAEAVRFVLRQVWLSEYAAEVGAARHRCQVKRIDPAKGSAVGYVSKYVAKNIDGFQVGADLEAEGASDASATAERVMAWASAHGIRQFQQIGGPAVTVWRELRRTHSPVSWAPVQSARDAAHEGDWRAFVEASGGIAAGRRGALALWSEVTGELTQYGELRGPQVVGVRCAAGPVRTRLKTWRIQRKVSEPKPTAYRDGRRRTVGASCAPVPSLGPVSITVRAANPVPSVPVTGAHRSGAPPGVAWTH